MATVKVRFYGRATSELEEALAWYAVRSASAEREFADAFESGLLSILDAPYRFASVSPTHRACRVKKFPYQIIYRVDGDIFTVVAVAHTSRRPGYWKRRR